VKTPAEIQEIKKILLTRKLSVPQHEIRLNLEKLEKAQEIFPLQMQRAMIIQLLHVYEHTKKKVVIQLEELAEKKAPITVVIGVLAEDWAGMANSVAGIIHQKEGNILFLKGFTVHVGSHVAGVVLLAFGIDSEEEYVRFKARKDQLIQIIREASLGSKGKTMLLEDETVKFEIYNQVIHRIRRLYRGKDISTLIGENGEALKFFSSRSREYLEERRIDDLAGLIIDNYHFQLEVGEGRTDKKIRIKNFETEYEKLTGITFCCREEHFSVESFLKSLEFIVPGHIIKHHKSFVNSDNILVYRIEIVDSYGKPLNPVMIKSVENSLAKLITAAANEKLSQVKAIGGFEHYGRAIIPFLMEELKTTGMNQVFINAEKKTDFMIQLKLVIVAARSTRPRLSQLIRKLEASPGIEIFSVVPPRFYKNQCEVDILNLRMNLAEFSSIHAVFATAKEHLKRVYGRIRDFNEGLRDADLHALSELSELSSDVNPLLLKEIYFSLDELYRLETPVPVIADMVRMCNETIQATNREPERPLIAYFQTIRLPPRDTPTKTLLIISHPRDKKVLTKLIHELTGVELYFTRIEWNQRAYLILILKKNGRALEETEIDRIKTLLRKKCCNDMLIIGRDQRQFFDGN
jgi:hypothetical protein